MLKVFSFTALAFSICCLVQCNAARQVVHPTLPEEEAIIGHNKGVKRSPYTVRGVRYTPMTIDKALSFKEEGIASYYSGRGGKSALGERVYSNDMNAAHKTLPLPCVVKVTNLANGKSCKLRVNDRGPFVKGRVIDVSVRAAKELGFYGRGVQRVRVEVLSVGDDQYKQVAK